MKSEGWKVFRQQEESHQENPQETNAAECLPPPPSTASTNDLAFGDEIDWGIPGFGHDPSLDIDIEKLLHSRDSTVVANSAETNEGKGRKDDCQTMSEPRVAFATDSGDRNTSVPSSSPPSVQKGWVQHLQGQGVTRWRGWRVRDVLEEHSLRSTTQGRGGKNKIINAEEVRTEALLKAYLKDEEDPALVALLQKHSEISGRSSGSGSFSAANDDDNDDGDDDDDDYDIDDDDHDDDDDGGGAGGGGNRASSSSSSSSRRGGSKNSSSGYDNGDAPCTTNVNSNSSSNSSRVIAGLGTEGRLRRTDFGAGRAEESFRLRVSRDPRQVLRYAWGAKPLWCSSPPPQVSFR
jgi:hypothetical protein